MLLRSLPALAVTLLVGAAAVPARADQNDPRLEGLFYQLRTASSPSDGKRAETEIWQIWSEADDEDGNILMLRGLVFMKRAEYAAALEAFDALARKAPNFAEAWNKKATVEFLLDDFDASVRDIERTLTLEPRHFGALSGLGQIYLALGRKEAALKAFEAALAINPHLSSLRSTVEDLRKEIGGRPT
jgi:tetratricopeptide (TPR) repeat protein